MMGDMPLCPGRRYPDDVPVLTHGDVTLRALTADDLDEVVVQCRDPGTLRWTTVPEDYDRAQAEDYLRDVVAPGWRAGTELGFAIEATHPDGARRFAGKVDLRDRGDRRAEIAFVVHPAVRGRGVATAACRLALEYGFEHLGLQSVIWWAVAGNEGSRRVAERLGFTVTGTLPRWLVARGEYRDAWVGTLPRP